MLKYSSDVIEDFADKMYSHATVIVALYAVAGFAFDFVGGWMIKGAAGGLIAGLVGSGLGSMVGQAKTAALRLQAQVPPSGSGPRIVREKHISRLRQSA